MLGLCHLAEMRWWGIAVSATSLAIKLFQPLSAESATAPRLWNSWWYSLSPRSRHRFARRQREVTENVTARAVNITGNQLVTNLACIGVSNTPGDIREVKGPLVEISEPAEENHKSD